MKLRWTIVAGLAMAGIFYVVVFLGPRNHVNSVLAATREVLHREGFKIDLKEFDLPTSSELRNRAARLTHDDLNVAGIWKDLAEIMPWHERLELMKPVGSNSAILIPKLASLRTETDEDVWPFLRDIMDRQRKSLDATCATALSGPIRFEMSPAKGPSFWQPPLSLIRDLSHLFSLRAVLEIHDQNQQAAWTNLLACVRMAVAWDPGPLEVSHLTRYECVTTAFNAVWQALQASEWTDAQLAQLQQEWESVDFFHGLPETVALDRASAVADCHVDQKSPVKAYLTLSETFHSPRQAWVQLNDYWRRLQYRNYGSYDDENALLLHYRDRELELRHAIQRPTWLEMRDLPGITRFVLFDSKHPSLMILKLHSRLMTSAFQKKGQGLLARAAEAEARRRLIIAAVALERYHRRHGAYPETLSNLSPEFLGHPPTDFMDGGPLRYRVTDDGHFILYSIGLHCIDDGGRMPCPGQRGALHAEAFERGVPHGTDLVWPRPASLEEMKPQEDQERREVEQELEAAWVRTTALRKWQEDERRLTVEKLLTAEQARKADSRSSQSNEPAYRGRPLSLILRNETGQPESPLTLEKLLTLSKVITGNEPEIVTFELPINYDAAMNLGFLSLLVDSHPNAQSQQCDRATNGNCLLVWNTIYDPPGRHAVQAQFSFADTNNNRTVNVNGPVTSFTSSNLFQLDPFYSNFTSRHGVAFCIWLSEPNGIYSLEIRSPDGPHIKMLSGSTSNGLVNARWNWVDDQGQRRANSPVTFVIHITLPDSGRSQTFKVP